MITPGDSTVINLETLKEIMDDDLELIQDCFQEFIEDWPSHYTEIKTAVLEKNAAMLDDAAHKLKGTLRYLAADTAAQAAYALESAGKEMDFGGTDEKLKNLKNECRKIIAYINDFKPV